MKSVKYKLLAMNAQPYRIIPLTLLCAAMSLLFACTQRSTRPQSVPPVLEFPESGLDDAATYRGYSTRFYQDSESNTLQIYINQHDGRVVNLWADAANESISFTTRDSAGQAAKLVWAAPAAEVISKGTTRYVQYSLLSQTPSLDVGRFILNTMRIERDFQYFKRHLLPFDAESFIPGELTDLIENLERLPINVRGRHLGLLHAESLDALHSRLAPQIKHPSSSRVLVEQPTFDGKNRLSLELSVDSSRTTIEISKSKISIRSLQNQPIELTVKIGTDSPALTPLQRDDIFNSDFFRFYERAKAEHDSIVQHSDAASKDVDENDSVLRFKRLQRQIKSMELMCSQEKFFAGLPNYATYFGRDMMMSALMLEPVLKPAMLEHVIASVLKKLTPTGEVSHEEGLGGQAVRENAEKYNKLIAAHLQHKAQGDETAANKTLADAEKTLANLQATTENYNMVDDDFQLPVLSARYLERSDISNDRKRAFLQSAVSKDDETSRLALLIRNLLYVSNVSRAYAENTTTENLVSFRKIDAHRWHAGSWRDSGVGYAGGRYAMDINAIWAPKALESAEKIFATLRELDISIDDLQTIAPELRATKLIEYAQKPDVLQQAVKTWRGAVRHFEVRLSFREIQRRLQAKLHWLPDEERTYWRNTIRKSAADQENIAFLALSLDENGQPIPVANTDVATWLFLNNFTEDILNGAIKPEQVLARLKIFVTPYPVGLLLEGVGPVVANDVYASTEVWENFQRDLYHSPRVIWGREVNLLFLGLAKQILTAYDAEGRLKNASLEAYVQELRAILNKTLTAVEASGLKHNELWSYRIENGKLLPARYPVSTDIQLWNLTDLAVQYQLARIERF